MRSRTTRLALAAVAALAVAGLGAPSLTSPAAAGPGKAAKPAKPGKPTEVRFATFNASLNAALRASWSRDLSAPGNAQAAGAAETIQRARRGRHPRQRVRLRRAARQPSCSATTTSRCARTAPHRRLPLLLRRAVQHRHPERVRPQQQRRDRVARAATTPSASACSRASTAWSSTRSTRSPPTTVRTFQHFLWKDMPGAVLPDDPATAAPADWYSPDELDVFRLSSKSHWDVPITLGASPSTSSSPTRRRRSSTAPRTATAGATTTRSASGPTTSRRKGCATSTTTRAARGGLPPGEQFVIAGDQNADPVDGDSYRRCDPAAARPPADHGPDADTRRARSRRPCHPGRHQPRRTRATPQLDTADFADNGARQPAGRLRPAQRATGGPRHRRLLAAVQPTRCSPA